MGWGGGYGYRIPQSGRDVAKAFYAGKRCKRTNCDTTGDNYYLLGSRIARRVRDEDMVEHIARAVQGLPYQRPLEFTFASWPTQLTCRHLLALGVDCEIATDWTIGPKGGRGAHFDVPLMMGKAVVVHSWYTLDELRDLPRWESQWDKHVAARPVRAVPTPVEQRTLEFA